MDKLFLELERDLRSLETATARSLMELDTEAGAELGRWLDKWTLLDDFA
jgi:hypothetical protein